MSGFGVHDFGMELHTVIRRRGSPIAAIAQRGVWPITEKPGGGFSTVSPCDIHTRLRSAAPAVNGERSSNSNVVGPYSRWVAGTSVPPRSRAINWIP